MDILAHGLWAAAAAKLTNRKLNSTVKKINPWQAAFWGIFPDLFAGAVPFVWMWSKVFFGTLSPSNFSKLDLVEHLAPGARDIFALWGALYNLSHSLIIFILFFGILCLFFRRPLWPMLGWPLHIIFDIPSHSADFYPTPFLWPLSNFHVDGISWGQRWFMIANYTAIIIVFLTLQLIKKKGEEIKQVVENTSFS